MRPETIWYTNISIWRLAVESLMTVSPTTSRRSNTLHGHHTRFLSSTQQSSSDRKRGINMESKTIIIETQTPRIKKIVRHSFTCQVYDELNRKIYVLDETKRRVRERRIFITPGCKIIDHGVVHIIGDIWYPPRPKYPHLIVFPEAIV